MLRRFQVLPALVMLALAGFFCTSAPAAAATTPEAQKVLRELDAASLKFKSAQADFVWDTYERVINETDTQRGSISFKRSGKSTLMAAQFVDAPNQPPSKLLVYRNGELKIYQPKIDQLTEFAAGKNRAQAESFLTLGFGGSGEELEKSWDVSYQGTETIDGVQTAKLDLVPKQQNVKNMFSHVTIWVDPERGVSLRQQFFEPNGDYRTTNFTNIRYNTPVSGRVFEIKTTSKTTVVKH
ncbi:MAG: LolA family protein [Acidobacteriaceae bacterium]